VDQESNSCKSLFVYVTDSLEAYYSSIHTEDFDSIDLPLSACVTQEWSSAHFLRQCVSRWLWIYARPHVCTTWWLMNRQTKLIRLQFYLWFYKYPTTNYSTLYRAILVCILIYVAVDSHVFIEQLNVNLVN